ncbi:MAG: hypothetical protein ACRDZ0_06510 [Acidimicrobiales bacterium]
MEPPDEFAEVVEDRTNGLGDGRAPTRARKQSHDLGEHGDLDTERLDVCFNQPDDRVLIRG